MQIKLPGSLSVLLLFHFSILLAQHPSDSLKADDKNIKPGITGFLATSFILNRNWKETSNTSILLALNIKARSSDQKTKKRITEVQAELAYLKFIDSVWIKNTDRFYFSNTWLMNRRKLSLSLSVSFASQLTDTWIEKNNGKMPERKWKSGPLLPATLVAGYGITYKPLARSYVTISLPAIKCGSMAWPVPGPHELKIIHQTSQYLIYREYGLSLQMNVEKKITAKITAANFTSLFVNKNLKTTADLEMINTISFRVVRSITVRLENKILYDEAISKRLQWKYDMMLGFNLSI